MLIAEPAAQKTPVEQEAQTAVPVAPAKVPCAQSMHVALPAALEKEPAGQAEHVELEAEKVPTGHVSGAAPAAQ